MENSERVEKVCVHVPTSESSASLKTFYKRKLSPYKQEQVKTQTMFLPLSLFVVDASYQVGGTIRKHLQRVQHLEGYNWI